MNKTRNAMLGIVSALALAAGFALYSCDGLAATKAGSESAPAERSAGGAIHLNKKKVAATSIRFQASNIQSLGGFDIDSIEWVPATGKATFVFKELDGIGDLFWSLFPWLDNKAETFKRFLKDNGRIVSKEYRGEPNPYYHEDPEGLTCTTKKLLSGFLRMLITPLFFKGRFSFDRASVHRKLPRSGKRGSGSLLRYPSVHGQRPVACRAG